MNPPAQARTASLENVPTGARVEVLRFTGGRGAGLKLAQLGIRAGVVLHVRRIAPMGGPVLLDLEGATLAVGRGLARLVSVRLLP